MTERRIQAEEIERVVVRGANWVGDAVMTVPALRRLRRALPRAHITLATRPWAQGIFDDAPFVDALLILDDAARGFRSFFRQTGEWRRRRFDLALLFPNAFAPALVAAAARVPFRLGYQTDGRRALLTHALDVPAWRAERHEVFYYLNLVAELEQRLDGAAEPDARTEPDTLTEPDTATTPELALAVSDVRRGEARELLTRLGLQLTRPVVALCPGSTNSRAKRWPSRFYAALADRLIDEAGVDCLLVGAREEMDVSTEVAAQMRRRPYTLTGRTSLSETMAVLSLTDLLITNDTGPAHIAAALKLPSLVIFGPTNPLTTRPFSPLAEVVRRPPSCAPCMLRECPIDHRCMTDITPEEVFARAAQALGCKAAGSMREAFDRTEVCG